MSRERVTAPPLRVNHRAGYVVAGCCWLVSVAVSGCSPSAPSSPAPPLVTQHAALAPSVPPPAVRQSEFRNARAESRYVGSQACAECHEEQFESYRRTTHSRALDEIDVDQQPPDGEVTHALSGRTYRVYREDDQFRHRELIKAPDGSEVVIADHPMRYVIGSGNHSRTYLVEMDGFLFESPVTWFTSRQGWDMSPGYRDDPTQPGFARPVTYECVLCHAGQVESVNGSLHRLKVHELAIGCERCHGPGSLHVQRHTHAAGDAGEFDDTIVHPDRLPRQRQIAICGQCHLATVAEANVRGRTIADFRPSLHLSDFRVRFQLASDSDAMTVVGHIEQMQASRCYQMSPAMTCTTCHNMHAGPDEQGQAGRQSCLGCHQPEACGLEAAERILKSPQDDCTSCHMPPSATDIPHFAFRHHRIGIHPDVPPPEPSQPVIGKLVAIDNLDHLPEIERNRCLGLAYVKLAEEGEVKKPEFYFRRALNLLEEVCEQRPGDAELTATLSRVYLHLGDTQRAIRHGRSALLAEDLSDQTQCDISGALSRAYVNQGDFRTARPFLEKLCRLRYDAEDHFLLSVCRHQAGDLAGALQAAGKAVNIEPDRPDLHDAMSELYLLHGDQEKSAWHRERSRQLRELLRVFVGGESAGGPASSP